MNIEDRKEKEVNEYIEELKENHDYDEQHDRIQAMTYREIWDELSDFDKEGWNSFEDWEKNQGYTELPCYAFSTNDGIVVFFDKVG